MKMKASAQNGLVKYIQILANVYRKHEIQYNLSKAGMRQSRHLVKSDKKSLLRPLTGEGGLALIEYNGLALKRIP